MVAVFGESELSKVEDQPWLLLQPFVVTAGKPITQNWPVDARCGDSQDGMDVENWLIFKVQIQAVGCKKVTASLA